MGWGIQDALPRKYWSKVDEFSMTSFTSPFNLELWLTLLVFPFVTGLFLWAIGSFPKDFKLLDLPKNVALSMSSMIGLNISNDNDEETKNSARLTIFVIFLCSSQFLYVYKSFIMSALAIPSTYKPFASPEELLYTNYR